MRLNFFHRPEVDTTMVMHTQLVEAAAKTLHYRHWLFDAASGTPIASHNGVGLLFSKADRKAVAIPPAVAARFAKSS
ncbi:MAG: acyl-CoA thioesterase FadM [Parvibaculaceae bacterium]|jgi:acyl-CoA thioesterase FadM